MSVSVESISSSIGDPSAAASGPRRPRPRRRWVPDAALTVVGLGLGATTGLAITAETHAALASRGGVATFVGSITGLVGMYLALVMVLIVSRIPLIERVLGLDGLLRWHRWLSPWPLSLIGLHAVFVTIGYAQATRSGIGHEVSALLSDYPGVLTATVALGLMALAGTVSIRAIRRRLRRETWWTIHLVMYVALALSFSHVIALGPTFVQHPLLQLVWTLVWIATAGLVIVFRFGIPLLRTLRHRLRVIEVRPEAHGVVSIVCEGRALDRLPARGGQFMCWRFLQSGIWWQAHPYSLSARPTATHLRLTVKNLGDHSGGLAQLEPGTRVMIEGPYGAFTTDAGRRQRAALIAGGIGVTATRALLEDLPRTARPIVILRVSREDDAALVGELAELARQRGGRLHVVCGPRERVRFDADTVERLVPGILQRDVYVCGRPSFVQHVVELVGGLGVPADAIHHEAYSL